MVFLIILGLVFSLDQISIFRWWFFVHMRHFDLDFLHFLVFIFLSDFFKNRFPKSLIVFSVNENSLNCSSGLVKLCFLFRQDFCHDHMTPKSLQIWVHTFCSFVHAISTGFREWRHFSVSFESFCIIRVKRFFWSHVTYLTIKNDLPSQTFSL